MTSWYVLSVFVGAIVISLALTMWAVYEMMAVWKIDLGTSAVDSKGSERTDHITTFAILIALAPVGAAFALGLAFMSGNWTFIGLALAVCICQVISAPYLALNAIRLPPEAAKPSAESGATPLRRPAA